MTFSGSLAGLLTKSQKALEKQILEEKNSYSSIESKRKNKMTVYELTEDQLYELKQSHLCKRDENISYDKLLDADIIVSDEEIFNEYGNVEFSEDDFFNI